MARFARGHGPDRVCDGLILPLTGDWVPPLPPPAPTRLRTGMAARLSGFVAVVLIFLPLWPATSHPKDPDRSDTLAGPFLMGVMLVPPPLDAVWAPWTDPQIPIDDAAPL